MKCSNYFSNVLANFFISRFAAHFVTALVISGGAMFQSLAQSILMLSLAAFVFAEYFCYDLAKLPTRCLGICLTLSPV